ncbi:S-layer homology domain-containing protein [Paenibacillus sp. Marseille-P2973]|uniref:S-layer homology domain-containing protein n=1 Tax=Paenibacillus sp. Marseille-P2973 TaxID=1871032 RepID=UPI001B39B6D4|nr:S-layer homology domain-containing protein [Paenibacillus sp. Marseille-P2973]MBQ4900041.1 S-layer homology domain-containing protein [Paenibacillus sp. Marseille-P2973]
MQRLKKPFLWLTLLSLVISLLPVGLLTPKVSAADAVPTYFIPSIQELRNTFSLSMTGTGDKQITRSSAHHVTTSTVTIEGSYRAGLSSTGMTVTVERLVQKNSTDWETDDSNVYSNIITALTGNTFRASDVTLFEGFNRITFSGQMGDTTRSESFYVLYDKVPYLQELIMYDGGSQGKALNEGTPVITTESMVSLEGIAQNVNEITIYVNGKISNSVPRDEYSGKFYAAGISLAIGANTIQIVMTNNADTVTSQRTIFRVGDGQSTTSLYLYDKDKRAGATGAVVYDAFNKTPSITETLVTPSIIGQIIVPYEYHKEEGNLNDWKKYLQLEYTPTGVTGATPVIITDAQIEILKMNPFNDNGKIDNNSIVIASRDKEVVISDAAGNPKYFIVTFSASGIPIDQGNLSLKASFGDVGNPGFSTTIPLSFRYAPGETTITNLYYLPAYKTTNDPESTDDYTKIKLDGATVDSGTFYVLIETNKNTVDWNSLEATYLPKGSKHLDIKDVEDSSINEKPASLTLEGNQKIYKIQNFSAGQQQLSFRFGTGAEARATVSYLMMTKIAFTNWIYGQTYSVNSKADNNVMLIEGEYLGFENFVPTENASATINGVSVPIVVSGQDVNKVIFTGNKFTLNAQISPNGPLFFGENRIIFKGTSRDGNGNARTVTGELLVYIVDTNGSTIGNFQPEAKTTVGLFSADSEGNTLVNLMTTILNVNDSVASSDLERAQAAYDKFISSIFVPSPSFTYDATATSYTTTNTTANLILRGSGASQVKLNFGSKEMFTAKERLVDNKVVTIDGQFSFDFGNGLKNYKYQLVGSEKDFLLRVEGIDISVPGTYVFNLELVNDSGSRTSKKLEIVRVVEPYRMLAPQANLDGQYIVNKNFVRFDIQAEGATKVLIDKYEAIPSQEEAGRFVYDYVGLKPDKSTKIKIQIQRADTTYNDTIEVYYTSAVNVDSQFMAEKVATKYSVFGKMIELSFPKGTILQTASPGLNAIQYYPDNKLLFGIADPVDGVVGKQDDYGNYVNRSLEGEPNKPNEIAVPYPVKAQFISPESRANFTAISNVYWIHGGLGEKGLIQSTNGLAPYSLEGSFTKFDPDRKIIPSKRGELTLAYDNNVVDDAGTTITVFRYTDAGIWENVGGEVDAKKHTVTVPFDDFGYYMVMKLKKGYSDITNHGWARNILNSLYAKGIMKNLRGNSFGTDDRITRGEFATLLVKGLNIPLNYPSSHQNSTFTDVGPGAATDTWSYAYIETAARAGIVTGTKEGEFAPYTPVTREQAAVMIARALKLKLALNDDKLNSALAKSFTDSGSIDYYARPSIQAVSKAKIMNGIASTLPGQKKASYSFNPKGYMTRAEAGKIAVELFKKSTAIFPKNFN